MPKKEEDERLIDSLQKRVDVASEVSKRIVNRLNTTEKLLDENMRFVKASLAKQIEEAQMDAGGRIKDAQAKFEKNISTVPGKGRCFSILYR